MCTSTNNIKPAVFRFLLPTTSTSCLIFVMKFIQTFKKMSGRTKQTSNAKAKTAIAFFGPMAKRICFYKYYNWLQKMEGSEEHWLSLVQANTKIFATSLLSFIRPQKSKSTWEDKSHDKMTSAYSKSSGYKNFSFHTTKKFRFQIVSLWRGPVHTIPDKFENATILLRLGLPSTLQRLYPHKNSRENGTF